MSSLNDFKNIFFMGLLLSLVGLSGFLIYTVTVPYFSSLRESDQSNSDILGEVEIKEVNSDTEENTIGNNNDNEPSSTGISANRPTVAGSQTSTSNGIDTSSEENSNKGTSNVSSEPEYSGFTFSKP